MYSYNPIHLLRFLRISYKDACAAPASIQLHNSGGIHGLGDHEVVVIRNHTVCPHTPVNHQAQRQWQGHTHTVLAVQPVGHHAVTLEILPFIRGFHQERARVHCVADDVHVGSKSCTGQGVNRTHQQTPGVALDLCVFSVRIMVVYALFFFVS